MAINLAELLAQLERESQPNTARERDYQEPKNTDGVAVKFYDLVCRRRVANLNSMT